MLVLFVAWLLAGCTKPVIVDADGDGFLASEDCNDHNPLVYPGAPETCNGQDDDCDGHVDNGVGQAYYADSDGDGYGDATKIATSCEAPSGYVAKSGDCNDQNAAIHPGAAETDCTDPTNYNCDGSTGYADVDADGSPACLDCNDTNPDIYPGAPEHCDGQDDDCDGLVDEQPVDAPTWYPDADGDGYGVTADGVQACEQPPGTSALPGDCDDTSTAYHPGAPETDCTDPHDYNCDGSTGYTDADHDGSPACLDCDDADPSVHPGAVEVCNGKDDDCNGTIDVGAVDAGTWYPDADGDGYGDPSTATTACTAPSGAIADGSDCDDTDATVFPGAPELCDGQRNDCSRAWTVASEAEHVTFTASSGTSTDVSSAWNAGDATTPAAVTVSDGTTTVCDGAYAVLVELSGGTLRSQNGAATTLLDGDAAGPVLTVDAGATAIVGGFTVQNGLVGLSIEGDLTCTDCDVVGNGGASRVDGGGVYVAAGSVSFVDSQVHGNEATVGGGLYVVGGDVRLEGTSVADNTADDEGGGLFVATGTGSVRCEDSASSPGGVTGNTAVNLGGGVSFAGTSLDVVSCNFGTPGVDDNVAPDDVDVYLPDGVNPQPMYGDDASFSCTAGTCL